MSMKMDAVVALLDGIYAGGACDCARAESAGALSDAFGGAAVMLFRQADAIVEDLEHAAWPEGSVALCTGRFADPAANRVLRSLPDAPVGVPLRADRVQPDFDATPIYQNAMKPFGLVHPLGALIARTARDVSVLSLMGKSSASPFDDEQERLLGRLIPALTSADRVRRLLIDVMDARLLLEQALDGVGRPVAVVDGGMRLRYANALGQEMLDHGSALRIHAGRLFAARASADEALRARVREAVAVNATAGLARLDTETGSLTLRLEPIRPSAAGFEQPLAMLVGARPPTISIADLRAAYGLTAKEAEVAALLAGGSGIGDTAVRLGRSVNTIKTEARQIYAKLGVGGHAQAAARIRDDLAG